METRAFCEELLEENRALRNLLFECDRFLLKIRGVVEMYLLSDNEYDEEQFIQQMLYYLEGYQQRALRRTIQETIRRMLLNEQVKE